MILTNLLMAASALVHALVGGQAQDEVPQRYYHCDFAPGVEFFVADKALMPAYRCVSGRVQLFIASQDFRAPYSNTEWIEELDVQLGDDVITQVFPGSFHYVRGSVHRPVHGLEFKSHSLAINGLTVLSARRL
ncbi:uncharacterized protein LOC117649537 [Thrips palmi]|uniref:Uncharacterized protein LOC117649537 n=1 Tax=Thrips palmi TaxID=161013 RepID=A0A6P8ZTG0_THRPL|nr:uncharacterized protein LOC117649537 [Thrips palmi]